MKEIDMPKDTCSVAECDRPTKSRGWCKSHYMWWYVNRETPTGAIRAWGRKSCAVPGCANPHSHRDYCAPHNKRLDAHGDAGGPEIRPQSVGDDAGYTLVHHRLSRSRGPAKLRACVRCRDQAAHWAYDHADPNEKVDPELGTAYSLDQNHYLPMCVSCHKRFDLSHKNGTPLEVLYLSN